MNEKTYNQIQVWLTPDRHGRKLLKTDIAKKLGISKQLLDYWLKVWRKRIGNTE